MSAHSATLRAFPATRVDDPIGTWRRVGRRLWLALIAHGERRAAAALRRMAVAQHDVDPALAQQLTAAAARRVTP